MIGAFVFGVEMEDFLLAIGGVVVMPLIIKLVNIFKDVATDWKGNQWRVVACVFGLVASVIGGLIKGVPTTLEGWAGLVIVGIAFGVGAFYSYDEAQNG